MNGLIKHGFSLGRVYVLEESILSQNEIERLFEAVKFSDMIHVLAESEYALYLKNITTETDIEEIFDDYLTDFYALLDEIGTPETRYFFRIKFDVMNIGNYLLNGAEVSLSSFGVIDKNVLLKLLNNKKYSEIASLLNLDVESFLTVFEESSENSIRILKSTYYAKLHSLASAGNIKFLSEVFRAYMDFENIRLLLRDILTVENFIQGGNLSYDDLLSDNSRQKISSLFPALSAVSNSNIEVYDKDFDNVLIAMLYKEKYKPLSKNRLVAFILAKELEVKNIRNLLLTGLNSFGSEEIENNLREVYA